MIKKILLFLIPIILGSIQAEAKIDIVYPTSQNLTVNAQSIFFIGNTDTGASMTINSNPVKLWENNFFVHVVPLNYGTNEIKLSSKINGKTDELKYIIKRNKITPYSTKQVNYEKNVTGVLIAKTINNFSTIREQPSSSSNRVIDLQKNVNLYLDGKLGDYYKLITNSDKQYWIHKSNIETPRIISNQNVATLRAQMYYSNDMYDFATFHLTEPVMYTIIQNENKLKLTLYGVNNKTDNEQGMPNFEYTFTMDRDILGYDCKYQDNDLTCRIAKVPEENNSYNPLKDITIFIDPGHGGVEKGSVGPTRVCEKDVNLAISKYLIQELNNDGANVITSRTDDRQIKLYDRVKMAKDNNALISLSIHSNALPNGKDPYLSHGTEVHYYNENAKVLAEIIKNNLVKDLNLKDNGIHRSSFALDRETNPVSVLVEVAYMINPEEYILLKNPEFQKKVAKSIKKSIEMYIVMLKK